MQYVIALVALLVIVASIAGSVHSLRDRNTLIREARRYGR